MTQKAIIITGVRQINFLFVVNVVFQSYHFSKQFLSNLSKIKYFAFFIIFCFFVGLAKMATLTTNIVDKNSAHIGNVFGVRHEDEGTLASKSRCH